MHNLIDDPNSRTVLKELYGLLYERLMETQDDYALKPAWVRRIELLGDAR